MHGSDEHLTIAQAARAAPGGHSPNCIWRWCRHGVKARDGARVRLRHIRIGGALYTTRAWIEEFGQRLAEADSRHFGLADKDCQGPRVSAGPRPAPKHRQAHLERLERDLKEAGL